MLTLVLTPVLSFLSSDPVCELPARNVHMLRVSLVVSCTTFIADGRHRSNRYTALNVSTTVASILHVTGRVVQSPDWLKHTTLHHCTITWLAETHNITSQRKFFKSVQEPSSCLFSLLPNPRDPSITTRLRSANKFPRLPSRTKNIRHYFLCSVSLSDFIDIQPLF